MMKKAFLAVALIGAAALALQAKPREKGHEGMRLAWAEEFDQDGPVDTSRWNFEEGFVRNNEDQWYTPDNAYCRNGLLVIEATADSIVNPRYNTLATDWRNSRAKSACASASINTRGKYQFLYGRMEVKARVPAGAGAWPAIWLLGTRYPWPSCGEIDVMELYPIDGVQHILANACVGSDTDPSGQKWNTKTVPLQHFLDKDPDWLSKFHLWAMDWTPESIDITLDGELVNSIPLSETFNGAEGHGENPFTKPQYILLNLAMGGNRGGKVEAEKLPLRYEVDYVRVYQ